MENREKKLVNYDFKYSTRSRLHNKKSKFWGFFGINKDVTISTTYKRYDEKDALMIIKILQGNLKTTDVIMHGGCHSCVTRSISKTLCYECQYYNNDDQNADNINGHRHIDWGRPDNSISRDELSSSRLYKQAEKISKTDDFAREYVQYFM